MKKLSLILLIFIFGCSKRKDIPKDNNQLSEDLNLYFSKIENPNLSTKQKRISFKKALNILDNQENSQKNRNILNKLVENSNKLRYTETTELISKLMLKKALQSRDTLNIANSFYYLGKFYLDTNKNDSSFYYYVKADKLFNRIKKTEKLNDLYIDVAFIYLYEGDYSNCESSASKSLSFINKNNIDYRKIYDSYNLIGISSNELKNFNKALEYHNKALIVAKSNLKKVRYNFVANSQNNIGVVYQNMGEYNNSIRYFKLALYQKDLEEDSPDLYAMLLDNLAYSKLKIGDYSKLPELFFTSLKLRESNDLTTGIIANKIHLSEYFNLVKNNDVSIKYANEALSIAKSSKSSGDILASLKQLSVVDNIKSAQYSNEYIKLSDSLQVAERNVKDKFARIQFETDEIIQEKDQLEEKNRNILNYFMGTILIGGVMFFLRSQRAKNRELILRQAQQKANEDIYKLIITQQNKLDEGRVLEKTRIAKELHDGVLGRLFGLRLNLDGLNDRKDEESVEMRLQYLSELKNIEQDLREISHELSREKFVLINNFVAIVSNLLDEQTKVNKANLKSFIGEDIDWDVLSNTTKINLYRILQESLQNINKYANAQNIKVDFKKDKKGNLILNIVDDGIGFDVDKKTRGIGIQNIISRTHESQGIIDIKSEKNKGTRITITVPLEGKTIKI